jgi:hypothetical protein
MAALYGLCQDPGDNPDDPKGPQCSNFDDFCFFCEFLETPDAVGTEADLYGSMKDIVNSMARQNREIPVIARTLQKNYDQCVREHVEYTHRVTGCVVERPVWSMAAITRHLLYSGEFKSLFPTVIRQMYHSIITRQNAVMIDPETGMVDGTRLNEFNSTVKTYLAFVKHEDGEHSARTSGAHHK